MTDIAPAPRRLRPLRGLLPFVRPYGTRIALALLFLLLSAGATLALPYAERLLVDQGLTTPGGDVGDKLFVGFRSDYCNYMCPLPLILPLGAIEYRRVAFMATYVPKAPNQENNGDVLFLFAKVALE